MIDQLKEQAKEKLSDVAIDDANLFAPLEQVSARWSSWNVSR